MTLRNPQSLHSPLAAYSHQAEVSGNANWLVMSAQIGMHKDGQIPEDVYTQTEIALENIMQNLHAAGMTKENLAKLTFYFVGTHDVERRRDIVNKALGEHAIAHRTVLKLNRDGTNQLINIYDGGNYENKHPIYSRSNNQIKSWRHPRTIG